MTRYQDITWSGSGWSINVSDRVRVSSPVGPFEINGDETHQLSLKRRWFRWELHRDNERLARLHGIHRGDLLSLKDAFHQLTVDNALDDALIWTVEVDGVFDHAVSAHRWITTESVDHLLARRPAQGLWARVSERGLLSSLNHHQQRAISIVDGDLESTAEATNRWIIERELVEEKEFFDSIESSPLTLEQATAVITFDNRVQVLAAAGSGKTSVMVARAAYAVRRGFVRPDQILLLAFNKAAAKELSERIETRFEAAGIDSSGVHAATFHSFGLEVIGRATGTKPRLAPWLDDDNGVGEILQIVDSLSDQSMGFRYDWDIYRLLFSSITQDLADDTPDAWDPQTSTAGLRTFAGEVVKSQGERLIADFLYLNGVTYRYEATYPIDLADETHAQYHPDFYYPDVDVWHEHWALDRDGNPPDEFIGYAESIEWKREVHSAHGTDLIETTWADVVFGDGLNSLRTQLEERGVIFDWDPDRPLNEWVRPIDHAGMARLVRTFMAHVKSNSFTKQDIERRVAHSPSHDGFRSRLFLRIYWRIHDEWERRLSSNGMVDFEDMLVAAAGHLERGEVDMGYELVMVDEFQDASRARARLARALVHTGGRFLLAVGDDWQSINRFAGSDLSVMTRFEEWFGRSRQLALTTTFRCPQTVCDVASTFISRNPVQFNKPMRSASPDPGPPVRVMLSDDTERAVSTCLHRLSEGLDSGIITPARHGKITVDVLGRYHFQREVLGRTPSNLEVRFRTAHSSKGLEADYIIVVGMSTGIHAFPSSIVDDPVLDLAMPVSDDFPHAEERRLFYVALTRARREVTIIAPLKQISPFVVEILDHPDVVTETLGGSGGQVTAAVAVCPECRTGTMVKRSGPYGSFLGCTNFPACRKTLKTR